MKRRDGFALAELLVVLTLASLITLGATVTVFHLLKVSRQNSEWSVAVRQAQAVGYWISRDQYAASLMETADDPGTPETELLTLTWREWQTGDVHAARYVLSPSSGSLQRLQREASVTDNGGAVKSSTSTLIADNVEAASVTVQADLSRKLTVQARAGSRYVVREYIVLPRPNYY